MGKHQASCSCGQLSLNYDGEITKTSICHCYSCQKRTGSIFGVQTRLVRKNVVINGQATKYDRPTDEGDTVPFYFCPNCGSTVYWEISDYPDFITVAAGMLIQSELPAPTFSVYEDRMRPWVVLPDSIVDHWA